MAEQSLKNKTVKGVAWSGIDNVAKYLVTFIVGIVLARLLSPDDYGLIGIISIFTVICQTVIDGGFLNALIRKKDVSEKDYNTVFISNLVASTFLYVLLFVGSPLIANLFAREELVSLTRVSSLGIIIGAFSIVQKAKLTKRIDFKTQTKVSFIASISSGVVGIGMATLNCGVWSLVFQSLSLNGFAAILLCIYNKWMPKLAFSTASFKELFGYSWKILVSGLLDSIWKELYQAVVGKFYSPATLGQYTRSKQFGQLFSSNLTSVVQRVTFPVLAEIQDDRERMKEAYRKIIKLTMFVTSISMFFLGAVSEPLLYCLIGPKWHEAATYLPLICINMSFYPLHAINLNMLQVQGKSNLFLYLEIIKKIIAIGPLVIGALVSIRWMLIVSIFTGIIAYFLNSAFSGKLIGYSSWSQIKDIAPSYGVASFTSIVVCFLKFLPFSNWIIFFLQIVAGVIIVLALCESFKFQEYKEVKCILFTYVRKVKSKE